MNTVGRKQAVFSIMSFDAVMVFCTQEEKEKNMFVLATIKPASKSNRTDEPFIRVVFITVLIFPVKKNERKQNRTAQNAECRMYSQHFFLAKTHAIKVCLEDVLRVRATVLMRV